MRPPTKRLSLRKARKPRPDALSSEEPSRTPRNALGDWRKIDQRSFRMYSRALSLAGSAEAFWTALRSRSHWLFSGSRERKFVWIREFPGSGLLYPPSFCHPRHDLVAWRILDFIHAISGG